MKNGRIGSLSVIIFLFVVLFFFVSAQVLQAAEDSTVNNTAGEADESSNEKEKGKPPTDSKPILDASGTYVLPEVIVTAARKKSRSEAIQDVPAAISVYSGETIEDNFIRDLTGIDRMAPNVKMDDIGTYPNSSNVFIRGMGVTSSIPSDEPTVGIFVDGMYLGTNIISLIDLFDVESVEVLRGPQGTLFGRNVTGGAVLVRHRRPTGKFGIRGKTTVGTYEWVEQNLVVEAPVTDKLAWKLGMLYRDKGGYYDNTLNSSDDLGDDRTWLVRPMFTWKPTENLEVTVIAEFSDFEGDGVPIRLLKDKNPIFPETPSTSSKSLITDMEPDADYHTEQIVVDINWNIGPGKLTSIAGYRQYKTSIEIDADGTGNVIFHSKGTNQQDQFSEELRYAMSFFDRIDLTTGVNFFTQNVKGAATRNILNGISKLAGDNFLDQYSVGFFSQGSVDLTDTLTLTLGGRYTWEEKDVKIASWKGDRTPDLTGFTYDFIDQERWDFVSWHGSLDWHPTDDITLYASTTRSFRSGGFNLRNTLPASPGPYGKERVDAFEVGIKADWLNGRVRTNLTGYLNDYKDLQRTVVGSNVEQEVLNAADATIKGFEAEITILPFDNFQLDFTLGYTDAKFDKYEGLDVTGDGVPDPKLAKHLDFMNVPDWTAYLGGAYFIPIPWEFGGELELRASASYRDSFPITEKNELRQNSYTLVDASMSYSFFDEHFKFSIFGKNLLDEHYTHFGLSNSLFDVEFMTRQGATGGIELSFEF
ncbi:MAG: TonB-dependent receptor [Planctomycetes bacterium]|nr:TonB-dependent receptor [Planctomycetota bacterium]